MGDEGTGRLRLAPMPLKIPSEEGIYMRGIVALGFMGRFQSSSARSIHFAGIQLNFDRLVDISVLLCVDRR
ncbi:hypothetical protein [Chamaesiphon sp. VAR_48_metabat_403]|uniref:hypothetical protein n=1 Tax=Chamaesiphon sp. VAR_48_metabat_403 TaxID=2964700 RepID=UPI00286E2FA9|nr:hypothetical protein [Chamaesiphon sp. VAR_48_metabat_403]